jgi:hypothetical protein
VTEAEWLACASPYKMLHGPLQGRASARKLRLWACACARRVWRLMPDERSRRAIEVAERYADGAATRGELREVREAAEQFGLAARVATPGTKATTHPAGQRTASEFRTAASLAADLVARQQEDVYIRPHSR